MSVAPDSIYWITPRWKLLWGLSAILILLSLLVMGMIPWMEHLYALALKQGRFTPASARGSIHQVYVLLGYFAFIGMLSSLLFFRLARYTIGIDNHRIYIKAGKTIICSLDADSVYWSYNTLSVCGSFISGIYIQRRNGFTVYPEQDLRDKLLPLLSQTRKISGWRMFLWALQQGSLHAWIIAVLALSLVLVIFWLYSIG